MELACALILFIVGLTTASPYGYGTKGGAGSKAEAVAVAGANTGVGAIPVSIPSGTGFSESFAKSYASSSASSSSSSSSSAYSYSGSGVIGTNGCASGSCNGGGAIESQGSPATGSQAYSGAKAESSIGGYGSKAQTGIHNLNNRGDDLHDEKPKDCGPDGGCSGKDGLMINGNARSGSQSSKGPKASIRGWLSGIISGILGGPECVGSDCKTTSGNDDNKKCASGQCDSNQDAEESSSTDYGTNDIQVKKPDASLPKSSYDSVQSGCSNGNCGSSSAPGSLSLPSYNKPATHLTVPKLDVSCSGTNCGNEQHYSPTDDKNPCNGGDCAYGQTKAPYTSTISQNINQISETPSSIGYGGALENTPSYAHGSSPSTAGSSPDCVPGTPGCNKISSAPSGCISGNCGQHPSNYGTKPSYFHGTSLPYSPGTSTDQSCTPGTPGCGIAPALSSSNDCASGNCGSHPSTPGYDGSSSIIPSYSQKPIGTGCQPGIPGCGLNPSFVIPSGCVPGTAGCNTYPSVPSFGGYSSNKPTVSSLPSISPGKLLVPSCQPGTPGCSVTPPFSHPLGCVAGNCLHPSALGYGSLSNIKPSYTNENLPSYSAGRPIGQGCVPGTPGCGTAPAVITSADCTSKNCVAYPSSQGGQGSSSFNSNSYSLSPSLNPSSPACVPGTIGCEQLPLTSGPFGCPSGKCGSYPSTPGYGVSGSIKPSYSHGNPHSYSQAKPDQPACPPGTSGCTVSPSDNNPTGCASGNCGTYPTAQGCPIGSPVCSGLPGSSRAPSVVLGSGGVSYDSTSSPLPSSSAVTGIPASSYGASGAGSSLHQANYGLHGSGSYNKPSSVFATGSSGSGAYTPGLPSSAGLVPEIGSPSYTSNVGATSGTNAQHATKEELPYTGGFGGPSGILKPNEFTAPISAYGNKPAVSSKPTSTTPALATSPSHAHVGSPGAQASASANAVAYTGGFGGPPGFLKPYDNGKVDLKPQTGNIHPSSSLGSQGISSVRPSYTNGGSQVSSNAVAQANAAAVSSVGVSSADKLHGDSSGAYPHDETSGAGGCGGGCGGNSGNSYGYSGSFGLSKTGVLDDPKNGLATAGAAAKSVASASSGARSYGSSFASSSAFAHATSGAGVKGGYGRR